MLANLPVETSASGEFQRQKDAFHEWISNDGSTSYPAVTGRGAFGEPLPDKIDKRLFGYSSNAPA